MQFGLQTRMSHTMSQDPLNRLRAEIVLEVTFAILVCLASVIGNVLVVYVVNKYSEMQTITNILIHNLALTDIISQCKCSAVQCSAVQVILGRFVLFEHLVFCM